MHVVTKTPALLHGRVSRDQRLASQTWVSLPSAKLSLRDFLLVLPHIDMVSCKDVRNWLPQQGDFLKIPSEI
jgi:hypothetical protein